MALTKIKTKNIKTGSISSSKIQEGTFTTSDPKISSISIANSTYEILDDTAVNIGGGYIVVTGSNFTNGSIISIGGTSAISTTYVNSTTLKAQVDSANAETYNVYVINPDGATGIKINGVTYSGTPTWVTNSTLTPQITDTAFNISLSATGATSYSNITALPAGTALLANGYFYGTISVESITNYNFTIRATDDENQDSDRTFSLTITVGVPPASVEYLIVSGGGGGGGHFGGGGGAGGLLTGTYSSISSATTYTVTVGSGGTAGPGYTSGTAPGNLGGGSGSNSSIFGISTSGGGGGGTRGFAEYYGKPGGSGGGGASEGGTTAGTGVSGQGNNGGAGYNSAANSAGGGGGGKGSGGSPAGSQTGGSGGAGYLSSISSSNLYYAGGGGGGSYQGTAGTGGSGGGGSGSVGDVLPTAGSVNTGGGGGGRGASPSGSNAAAGGSGVVIVRYADSYADAVVSGSPTFTTTGGYKIYKFTGSGSIAW